MKKVTFDLWQPFTDAELQEKAQLMSAAMLRYDEVELDKKAATQQFTEQMKALRGEMRVFSKQIRAKGCEKPIECVINFHTPHVAMKRIVRLDTGELVREETMTPEECQENLFTDPREIDELNKIYGDKMPEENRPQA